ncbi:MAG: hypothetical protein ACM4D3_24700 [Candidatus Sericytochromatia bacterium]
MTDHGDDEMLRALDPDNDAVPEELRRLDGQQVFVDGEPAVLLILPGQFGDARRRRES